MAEEEVQTQKYSSGINIIIRLDILWKDTHRHSRQGMYLMWNLDLDRIWLELARDLDEKEFTPKEIEYKKFETKLEEKMPFNDSAPEGFREPTKDEILKRNKIYNILMDKQRFLARLENELGKGTTFSSGDESDWE